MTEKKIQNSVMFFTTLGVYLGLMLVGATPVLGHAATTRNFEISDEVEIKDDFDRKPDDCDDLRQKAEKSSKAYGSRTEAIGEYGAIIEKLVRALNDPERIGFSFTAASFPTTGGVPGISLDGPKPVLFPKHSREQIDEQLRGLLAIVPNAGTIPENRFTVDFDHDTLGLNSTSVYSREDDYSAHLLFVSLSASKDFWRCDASSKPILRTILAGTEIRHKGNQVFIVTRLPRAALDTLLAKNAK